MNKYTKQINRNITYHRVLERLINTSTFILKDYVTEPYFARFEHDDGATVNLEMQGATSEQMEVRIYTQTASTTIYIGDYETKSIESLSDKVMDVLGKVMEMDNES